MSPAGLDEARQPALLLERGKAFAAVGDATRAEQYLASAMAAGAPERDVLPVLLRICVESKRYRGALEYARSALARRPHDTSLRFLVAALHAGIGETERAREELLRVVTDEPRNAEAHFALGVLLRESHGDAKLRDDAFRTYLELAPRGEHAEEAGASLLRSVERSTRP
jgi:tetratricopeptide (TPR) repeat protein